MNGGQRPSERAVEAIRRGNKSELQADLKPTKPRMMWLRGLLNGPRVRPSMLRTAGPVCARNGWTVFDKATRTDTLTKLGRRIIVAFDARTQERLASNAITLRATFREFRLGDMPLRLWEGASAEGAPVRALLCLLLPGTNPSDILGLQEVNTTVFGPLSGGDDE